jgi:cytochrome c
MRRSGLTWDAETLSRFLQSPSKVVPGTRMAFPGLSKPEDRADVIAYLAQYAADGTNK